MSKFRTIQQQNAEKVIDAMFAGLGDDTALKTVMRVMYGLDDESVLDELKRVNDANMEALNERMALKQEDAVSAGKLIQSGETDVIIPPESIGE